MSTTAFQFLIDRAETLSIDERLMTATTTARDGTVRAVSRGAQPARIEIKLPDGLPYDQIKDAIAALIQADRIETGSITIPFAGYEWFYKNINPVTPVTYQVRCIEFPKWTVFARNQVSWSGPFVLQEVI